MKTLFHFAFIYLLGLSAQAYCGLNSISVFPRNEFIKANSIFILTGDSEDQKIIDGLNKEYPIYLVSGSEKVQLLVKEILVGDLYLTQAILYPETELKLNLKYVLTIENLPKQEILRRFNTETKTYNPISFTIISNKDKTKPKIKREPKVIEEILMYWGCGKEVKIIFEFKVKDDSEVVVRALVRNRMTGKETEFYVSLINDKMVLGKNMCSGAFLFEKAVPYEAEFVVMDASGNRAEYSRMPINLSRPSKRTFPKYLKSDLEFETIELDDL